MVESRCNLVHAFAESIMIDLPWRLLHGTECGKFTSIRNQELAAFVSASEPRECRKPMIPVWFYSSLIRDRMAAR
jgi:hypothetical protein